MLNSIKKLIFGLFFVTSPLLARVNPITLNEKNSIVLRGQINDQSVAKISYEILRHDLDEFYLYISSPGGSVFAGMQLINIIKNSGKKIHCIASVAASMAFVILQACETRYIMESSILMQHVASYGVKGNAPNNMSMVKFIEGALLDIDRMQASRIGMSVNDFRKKTRNDWWFFGANAVKEKVADKIASVTCDKDLTNSTYTENIRFAFFSFDVTWSKCPLIEEPLEIKTSNTSPKKNIETDKDEKIYNSFLKTIQTRNTINEMIRKRK